MEHRWRADEGETTGQVDVVEGARETGAVDVLVDGAGEASRASLPPQQAGSAKSTTKVASDRRRTRCTTRSTAAATPSAWLAGPHCCHHRRTGALAPTKVD